MAVVEYDVTLPESQPTPPSKWDREDEAFRLMFPILIEEYRNQYVAIHEGTVVAHGPDQVDVAMQAYLKFGQIPILVRKVTTDAPRIVRIPSFTKA